MHPEPAPAAPAAGRNSRALWGLLVLAGVFALREAKALMAPVLIAVILTFVLAPLVHRLRRHGVPEALGAALVVGALLGSTVPLAASLARPAALWWQQAPATVAQLLAQFERLRATIPGLGRSAPPPRPPGAAPAAPAADPVTERLASEGVALTGTLLGHGVSFGLSAAATVILLYFLLAAEHWLLSRCVEAVRRPRTRALVLGGVRAAQREIGRYLVAVGCLNLGAGIATGLVVAALGLPNPTLWGAVVAVFSLVPYLGPLLVMALLLLAGVTTFESGPQTLAPMLAFMAIHAIETQLVAPWFVGRRLALSPVSVFLAVMFWGWLWGIAGALIAVPLLIALRSVCRRTRRLRLLARLLEGPHHAQPSRQALLQTPRKGT